MHGTVARQNNPLPPPADAGILTEDTIQAGKYIYMEALHSLASQVAPIPAPPQIIGTRTPLKVAAWEYHLRAHPDREFVQYLLEGLQHGFRIGFDYGKCKCRSAKCNMLSATQNPEVIQQYLTKECSLGRVLGPFDKGSMDIQVNRFGVIPKPHQPGKWRLILDLSHPILGSVNAGIDSKFCTLSYISVEDAARVILRKGKGTLLAKLDLESAYRMVPVHPDDRRLLGMEWDGGLYIDTALPFGLRSAPKIFNAVADGLLWIMGNSGIHSAMHYLDDYAFFGDPGSQECGEALRLALAICSDLGIPVAQHKLEGPTTALVFLGILIDTEKSELRLPQDKLTRLQILIQKWLGKKSCTKRELLSLIGHLQHACRVVPPGRSFLRRMIDLSATAKELHHHIRLNAGFRSDLQWWAMFLSDWNGVRLLSVRSIACSKMVITSDASGNWGCGAFCTNNRWFQVQWPDSWSSVHITVKELLPIVVACAVWGKAWKGMTVKVRCDNAAVVCIVNSGRSKDHRAMHLMRCLFFFLANYNMFIFAEHIPGKDNVAADSLSRDNLCLFRHQVPSAAPDPTPIPDELLQALILQQPEWTLFSSILQKV